MALGYTGLILRRWPVFSLDNVVTLWAAESFDKVDGTPTACEYKTHTLKFNSRFRARLFYERISRGQWSRYVWYKNTVNHR